MFSLASVPCEPHPFILLFSLFPFAEACEMLCSCFCFLEQQIPCEPHSCELNDIYYSLLGYFSNAFTYDWSVDAA